MLSWANSLRIWRTALLPIVDFISLVIGIGLVYLIRYRWFRSEFFGIQRITSSQFLLITVILAIIIVIIYAIFGLYEIRRQRRWWSTFFHLFIGIFLCLLSIITFFFFYEYNQDILPQGVPVSRFILLTGGFVALYSVLLGRAAVWAVEQILWHLKVLRIKVAVIGINDENVLNDLKKDKSVGEIITYNDLDEEIMAELETEMSKGDLSEIYLFGQQNPLESKLAWLAERYKTGFIFSPEGFSDFQSFGLKPIIIGKKVFLELTHTNLDGWQVVLKRVFDILFAICFLVLFSWLYLLIILAIKIDSSGPVFYFSERVGPDGKNFRAWKFRRMKKEFCTSEKDAATLEYEQKLIQELDIRKDGVLYKVENDPRNTRVGRFLEKTSLDELPQFFNVLIGNMSVVGPRPHQPREVAKYAHHHYKVLNIKPGITGLAQINGRSDLKFDQEVEFDKFYIEHWNFWLDLWIVVQTPLILIGRRHRS